MQISKERRLNGFTLIELLVVIAIIAVLASILFPVFAGAKENAKRSNCQSNMKQLAIGLSLYIDDYHGHYPSQPEDGVFDWGLPSAKPNWARSVVYYIKDGIINRCPSATKNSSCRTGCAMVVDSVSYPISYFGNGYIFKDGINESVITKPSRVLVFQCCGQAWNACWLAPSWNDEYSVWESYTHPSWCVHKGGTNISYADGHTKWMNYKELSADLSIFTPMK